MNTACPVPARIALRTRAELALIGITVVWGTTFVVVKDALDHVSPILFIALRFVVATAALGLLLRKRLLFNRATVRAGLILGVFLFLGYAFQTVGLRYTTPSKSAFLTGLSIVMVPLLGSLVYRIKPRIVELVGIALATVGMVLMTLPKSGFSLAPGDLLTLACAVAFAGHIVALGHFAGQGKTETLATLQIGTATVLALALFWALERPAIELNTGVIVAIGITGLLATALAFGVQAWAQQFTTSTRTALIFALEPVFAWVTSYMLKGETLSARSAAGAGLILAGILLVELKPFAIAQHPSR